MTATARLHDSEIVGHAYAALGHHIAEHRLPAPFDVRVSADAIEVSIPGRAAAAWMLSVAVDRADYADDGATGYSRALVEGRLLGSGLRVRLRWARRVEDREVA